MAIDKRDQLFYVGKGPLDAKSLVKTYAELTNPATWTVKVDNEDTFIAYNSMIVGVWLNKEDPSKNGLYFLFDSSVTSALKKPDVTNTENWHKLADVDLTDRLNTIDERLTALEKDSDVITYGYRKDFPGVGEINKMYIAADEGKTYIWFNDDYLPVGGGDYEEPTMIYGGDSGV
jgi:hypothetical protein